MQLVDIEYLNSFSKSCLAFVQDVNAINSRAIHQLADLQLNFASQQLDNTLKHLKLYTSTTDPRLLLSAVSELAGQYGNGTVGVTRKATSILTTSREEIISLLDKRFETTAKTEKKPVKHTAKKTVKA